MINITDDFKLYTELEFNNDNPFTVFSEYSDEELEYLGYEEGE